MTAPAQTTAIAHNALRRLFEQALLILLLVFVVWALLDKARDTRGAAELSAVRGNLGALRVALVLEQMRRVTAPSMQSEVAHRNPFLLLKRPPVNYAGEVALDDAVRGMVAPGFWFFDQRAALIGYRVNDVRRFHAASGRQVMAFELSQMDLLAAREVYIWNDEVVN